MYVYIDQHGIIFYLMGRVLELSLKHTSNPKLCESFPILIDDLVVELQSALNRHKYHIEL